MSHNRRNRDSKPRSEKHEERTLRARRDDANVDNRREDVNKSIVEEGRDVYVIGSLKEPALAPGDFGRDIGDETDLWI